MARSFPIRISAQLMCLPAVLACGESEAPDQAPPGAELGPEPSLVIDGTAAIPQNEEEQDAHEAMLDAEFPLHGLVTGLQLQVRQQPDPEADAVGWLRIGNRVRLKTSSSRTPTCSSGWHEIYPRGFACAGEGIEVGQEPPDSELAVAPPSRDSALPYSYWFVSEPMTAEYHRPPSRDEQRAAVAFAARYLELLEENESRARRLLDGEMPNEPQKPAVVYRYLDRGFFVAGVGVEVRASRNFVRTVRGRYVKQARLLERTGPEFSGVELGDEFTLPVVWSVREAHYRSMRERDDGIRFPIDHDLEPIPRQERVTNWVRRENIGGDYMHVLETDAGTRYVRDWFLSVAERRERPREVRADEPWVHVNVDQQNLVLYEGDEPVFTTLISSGQEGFETPAGVFEVHRKYVADTMANVGDGNDDRYSIEDVPWAQYFDGSIALHGAFWHSRFGLPRSHGCVNLSPPDARRVFDTLWPRTPQGWLGVTAGSSSFRASHVVVTHE